MRAKKTALHPQPRRTDDVQSFRSKQKGCRFSRQSEETLIKAVIEFAFAPWLLR
jgi:hypothetical protein